MLKGLYKFHADDKKSSIFNIKNVNLLRNHLLQGLWKI
jgi:hypothetical protein